MKVCVLGLWHLGTVTAACLADHGHEVVGLDFDPPVVAALAGGTPPLVEPGLTELVQSGLGAGRLSFTTDAAVASSADVVWVAYDTPVDDEDRANVDYVVERVERLFPHLRSGSLVLISSQVPVGTTARLEGRFARTASGRVVGFACSPENLRLGGAIAAFTAPDRIVVGARTAADRERLEMLLQPFGSDIEWMSVESAEMT